MGAPAAADGAFASYSTKELVGHKRRVRAPCCWLPNQRAFMAAASGQPLHAGELAGVESQRQEARHGRLRQGRLHLARRAARPCARAPPPPQRAHAPPPGPRKRGWRGVQGKADKALVTLAGHGDWVQQVVWDPSHEEQVASAADDKTIRCQSTGLLSPCAHASLWPGVHAWPAPNSPRLQSLRLARTPCAAAASTGRRFTCLFAFARAAAGGLSASAAPSGLSAFG